MSEVTLQYRSRVQVREIFQVVSPETPGWTARHSQSASQKPTQKEGEISIDKIPNSKPSKHDVGEYVDYEDVE